MIEIGETTVFSGAAAARVRRFLASVRGYRPRYTVPEPGGGK